MPGIMAKTVLFNDGEGLDLEDLNNLQRYIGALIGDGLVAGSAPHLDLTAVNRMPETHLFALGNAGAPFENGSGARTPNFLEGLVAQRIGATTTDGNDSQVLLYYVGPDEPTPANTSRPAATTDPRWDVISVQLAYADADPQTRDFEDASTRALTSPTVDKQRRVEATFAWTQGVEAASPVEPATPVGHVKLAAFMVSPGMTVFDPKTDIRDYRMPIGPATVHASRNWHFPRDAAGASGYAEGGLIGSGNIVSESGANDIAVNSCPVAGARRVLRVGIGSAATGGGPTHTLNLRRRGQASSGTVLRDLSSLLATSATAVFDDFDILSSHGAPLWANGYSAGYAVEQLGASATDTASLELAFAPDAAVQTILKEVRWTLVG